MQPEFPNNKENNPSKNEQDDENMQKHEQSVKILSLTEKPYYFFKFLPQFFSMKQTVNSKNSRNQYFLLSSEWFNKFQNYCNSDEIFSEFDCPSEINNNSIIIQDNSALKIDNDMNIFFNNKLKSTTSICVVIKEIWTKLKKIFGGGPEYEIIYQPDKNFSNFINLGARINLLFIKSKIKNIQVNDNINDYVISKHIYLDMKENVLYLKKYINGILEKYKNNFFSSDNVDTPQENINYRLWLYSTFYGKPKTISEFIKTQIINLRNENILLYKNILIDWTKFNKINQYKFQIIPLSFFDTNLIGDIFPNRYTQYFDYSREFGNLKFEEEHSLPIFTIIIEESPFFFITEDMIYRLGSCTKCSYKQITYNACECKNCFFCLESCEKIYREKRNEHFKTCKIHLMSTFSNENKKYYHNDNNDELIFSLTGLANLGNTCYMNSALQCLRAIKELTDYFLNYFDEDKLNKTNLMGTGGLLALAYANYIFKMNSNDKNFIELKNFKYSIGIVDDRFSGYDQQDTHEFLSFLIDSIHEDLNKVIVKPIVKRKNSDWEQRYKSIEILDKLKSKIEWNNFLKRNQSIMVDLFYGQYKTSIICPKCQHNSTNFSIFLSLQLPIPISNNYFTIKVFLYEEWLDNKDYIYFEIILSKNNNKVIIAKKIIGRLFGISPYQIEIYKTNKMEITKVYNNDEELTENVTFIRAVKINLKTIKDVGNNFEQNIIDYRCIEKRIENRIDDYISFVKNINDNVNNSDDECNIIIDINCGDVENIAEINYEKESLQKFIIKHYTFENDNTKTIIKSIHKDFLIYTKTNQTCYDLYFQIFLVYSSVLIVKQLGISEIKDLDDLNKNRDLIKNLFDKYFKRHIEEENQFNDEEIFEIYPELPFFLKLKVYKSKESKFIPKSKKMKFKKFLNSQMEKENKYNENKYKSTDNMKYYEDSKEDSLIKIEINNNKPNDYENKSLSSKSNINIKNQNYNYDPLNPMNPSIINLGKEKFSSSKNNLVLNGKEKSSKNNAANNNIVHSIIIIFNRNYLNTNGNNEHYLTDITYNKIDLSNIFKHAHQNIEKISINKCFEEFTKMQTLDENNLYKCPKCKENIAARNKIELYKIPKILIIQLKRFENGQKIKTFIDFPIKNLDISSFISNSSQHYLTPPIKYDLFAVSNHYGELEYGHYNASCLNYTDKHWYNFNDKKVEIIEDDNPDSIVTKDAYVLFYRQRKLESIDWKHIYNKQYKDIKDDNYLENININEIKNNNNNNLKNNFIIKSGIIELDEEEDEKEVEQDNLVDEEISLDSFVYNPFRDSYLKLKRRRLKEK